MSYTVFVGVVAHGINLVFHKGNERRDDDSGTVHEQRGQLITHTLATACGHKHESIVAIHKVGDDSFLVAFERFETEMFA